MSNPLILLIFFLTARLWLLHLDLEVPAWSVEVELSAGGDDPSALEAVRSLGLVAFSVREDEVAIDPALVLVRVLVI